MRVRFHALLATVAVCSTAVAAPPVLHPHAQLEFELKSGSYLCEFGQVIDVRRDLKSAANVNIGWKGTRYTMLRDPSFSGLPRYEDRRNGLVWIELPWKGVLLDARTQKPLANECKTI